MAELATIFERVGVPTAFLIVMIVANWKMKQSHDKEREKTHERHASERKDWQKESTRVQDRQTEAFNNVQTALVELTKSIESNRRRD